MIGPLYLITLTSTGLFILLVPAILVGLAAGEGAVALEMSLLASLGAFVAIMLLAALSGRIRSIERELNFVSLVLVWLFVPLIAALALMVVTGLGFMSAWFEAVSALTTSGGTVLARNTLPQGILFWRASLEWYGGFLTLLSIIYVLAPAGFGGLLPSGRMRGATIRESSWGGFHAYTSVLWQYAALTAIVVLGLIFAGVDPSEAAMLAMMSVATGGFLPFEGALDEHIGTGAILIVAMGLCFGTLSVFWRRNILRNPRRLWQENFEAKLVVAGIAILTVIYAARIVEVSGVSLMDSFGSVLLESFFAATSLVATSGIETRPGIIALLPSFAVLLVVIVGASVYSTSGGIKYYRIATMVVFAFAELNRLVYPHGVSALKFGKEHLSEHDMRAIWVYFMLALLCVAVGTVIITATDADFEGGLAMAITFFASAAPAYDALRPAAAELAAAGVPNSWPRFAELSPFTYLPAIALMTIGRLEVLIVFAVINLRYWMNR